MLGEILDLLNEVFLYTDTATRLAFSITSKNAFIYRPLKKGLLRIKLADKCKHKGFILYPRDYIEHLKYGNLAWVTYNIEDEITLLRYRALPEIKKYCNLYKGSLEKKDKYHARVIFAMHRNKNPEVIVYFKEEYPQQFIFFLRTIMGQRNMEYFASYIHNFNQISGNPLKLKHFIFLYNYYKEKKGRAPVMPNSAGDWPSKEIKDWLASQSILA